MHWQMQLIHSGIEKSSQQLAGHGEIMHTSSCRSFTKEAMVCPQKQQSLMMLHMHDCMYMGVPNFMQQLMMVNDLVWEVRLAGA